MRLGRKGGSADMFYLIAVFISFGIMLLLGLYLKDQIFPQFITAFGNTSTAANVINTSENVFNAMDNIFLFFYFMMMLTVVISAALVPTHPIFLIINVIIMIILFVITPALSNVMQEFWSVPEFAPYAAGGSGSVTLPIMTNIFRFLPIITLGVSILIMIATFSKKDERGRY